MDLVASAQNIIVAMLHTNTRGESKLLPRCSLPLTGLGCVKKVVTDLAVLDITPEGFVLLETAPGVTIEEVKSKTAGRLVIPATVGQMKGCRNQDGYPEPSTNEKKLLK
ncbi:MAG TPA: CoA-transferase, partial [Chitinophaga sp.]